MRNKIIKLFTHNYKSRIINYSRNCSAIPCSSVSGHLKVINKKYNYFISTTQHTSVLMLLSHSKRYKILISQKGYLTRVSIISSKSPKMLVVDLISMDVHYVEANAMDKFWMDGDWPSSWELRRCDAMWCDGQGLRMKWVDLGWLANHRDRALLFGSRKFNHSPLRCIVIWSWKFTMIWSG